MGEEEEDYEEEEEKEVLSSQVFDFAFAVRTSTSLQEKKFRINERMK